MSVAEARAFVVSLQEAGLAPSSVAGFVRGLRAFSAWCAAEGLVAEHPLRRLPRPQVPSRLIGTLGPVELERLLAVASRRYRLIVALLLDIGLRLSDVDHVFLARDGRPLTSAAIQHALRRLGGRAGLDGVRTNPHTFRHTFAKLYLLNAGDLFTLQKILGHTTLDMVRRYVNLDTDEVKRQHAQASPVDRLAIGPKVTVLLPWRVADRLEELAWRERTSIEDLVVRGAAQLAESSADFAWQRSAMAA